ncbi:hypothetical protein [Streptomyces shenzhenensis]|uniref:hypothetical protein n=1 Tax=Streptomyces shenzhenensis TaxID=943815 RepID=UPI001F354C70|nr:hypothetical protein [Streptomyces shenzhenensis]
MIAQLSCPARFWRNTTAINYDLAPAWLPWSAVDPSRIAFAWDEAEASEITTVIASMVPAEEIEWEERYSFTTEVTALSLGCLAPGQEPHRLEFRGRTDTGPGRARRGRPRNLVQ